MASIFKEIKEQPEHIRKMFMWTSVVITFSVIGFVWFQSTTKQFVALLNPEDYEATQNLAEEKKTSSPFATILFSWDQVKASIGQLLNFDEENEFKIKSQNILPLVSPQFLPVAGDK